MKRGALLDFITFPLQAFVKTNSPTLPQWNQDLMSLTIEADVKQILY